MSHRIRIAIVACLGASIVIAVWGALRMGRVDIPRDPLPASVTTDTELDAAMREQLTRREREIESLRAEILRLEALLAQRREVVAPAREGTLEESANGEVSNSNATVATNGIESARRVLQALLPDRFGSMTAEELAALTNLDLHGSKATDADLAVLSALPSLTCISLRGTAVTDAGIGALAGASLVTAIDLRDTQISGAGLATLPLNRLDALHLTGTRVSGDDIRRLPSMPNLHVLKLNRLSVGDDSLRDLPYLPGLNHLELDNTQVTAAGLRDALNANRSLQRVELRGTAIDQDAVAKLHADYPNVEFVVDNFDPRWAAIRR